MQAKFLQKLSLFLLIPAAYVVVTSTIAFYDGEFTPLRQVAAAQAEQTPLLYGRAYRDNLFAYKLISAQYRKPEVLVLGSSRVQQFRSLLINKTSSAFYNAGRATQSIYETQQFLQALDPAALPKVLILGLDQPWFDMQSGYSLPPDAPQSIDDESTPDLTRLLNVDRSILLDILARKISPGKLLARQEPVHGVAGLGLNSILNGMGFRNDGSYQYGSDILNPSPNDARLADGFDSLLKNKEGHFVAGSDVAPASIAALETILQYGKQHGVYVIGFSPPYAPTIYAQMMADGRHQYIPKMVAELQAVFKRNGFAYFDFSDAAQLGATEEDMVDGYHASEYIYLKLYAQMLTSLPDILGQYSDSDYLARMEQQPMSNRFELYGTY